MKTFGQFLIKGTISIAVLLFFSCTKNAENHAPPFSSQIAAPVANAGDDQKIQLPANSVALKGTYKISQSIFSQSTWKKLAGPSCTIETPSALTTQVRRLEEGVYVFEFSVSNNFNLEGRDTVIVTVRSSGVTVGQGFTVFRSMKWQPIWYPTLVVPGIFGYLPNGVIKKVYVQRANSNDWIEAQPVTTSSTNNSTYEYFIETRLDGAGMYSYGSLNVVLTNWTNDKTEDTPSIKVEY